MIIKVRTRIDTTHDRPGYDPKRGPITVDLCVEGGEPQRLTEAKKDPGLQKVTSAGPETKPLN